MRTPRTLILALSGAALLAIVGTGIAAAGTPDPTTTLGAAHLADVAPTPVQASVIEQAPVITPAAPAATVAAPAAKPEGYTLPAGQDSGFLAGFGGDVGGITVFFDRAYLLGPEEAVAHGYPEPAGAYHLQNDNPEERTLGLSPDASVTVFDADPTATRVITAGDFADTYDAHTGGFYNFSVDENGTITAATEVWLP